MEIQNLRLQLLHIANGNVYKAQEMETYVLGETKDAGVGTGESNTATQNADGKPSTESEKCSCFICLMSQIIEKDFRKVEH